MEKACKFCDKKCPMIDGNKHYVYVYSDIERDYVDSIIVCGKLISDEDYPAWNEGVKQIELFM